MTEFEKGDKVRVIDVKGQDPLRTLVLSLGEIHTVEEVTRHGWLRFGGYDWLPERFEKVEPKPVVGPPFKPGDPVWIYPAEMDGKPAWAIQRAPKKTEVEPEWVVGQEVSGDDFARLPVGTVVEHHSGVIRTKTADGRWVPEPAHFLKLPDDVMESPRTITYLPDAPEPEDTDDVEPEPLKEGDWVQVWAQVHMVEPDRDGDIELMMDHIGGQGIGYTNPRAIVRPGADQQPPWVKPARCTSLLMVDKTTNLRQCTRDDDGHDNHAAYGASWTDAEEYGHVEVRS